MGIGQRLLWSLCGCWTVSMATSGCAASSDREQAVASEPVIIGTDDRLDVYQLGGSSAIARNADGVALLAFTASVAAHDGIVALPLQTLAQERNVCGSERYAGQSVSSAGHCRAYLVAPRLVVTAGHCTDFAAVGTDVRCQARFTLPPPDGKTA